jgi:hypothetical protein
MSQRTAFTCLPTMFIVDDAQARGGRGSGSS